MGSFNWLNYIDYLHKHNKLILVAPYTHPLGSFNIGSYRFGSFNSFGSYRFGSFNSFNSYHIGSFNLGSYNLSSYSAFTLGSYSFYTHINSFNLSSFNFGSFNLTAFINITDNGEYEFFALPEELHGEPLNMFGYGIDLI